MAARAYLDAGKDKTLSHEEDQPLSMVTIVANVRGAYLHADKSGGDVRFTYSNFWGNRFPPPDGVGNLAKDPLFAPWRREAVEHGYASALALPLCVNSSLGAEEAEHHPLRHVLLQAAWELNEYWPPVVNGPTLSGNVRWRSTARKRRTGPRSIACSPR